MKLVQNLITRAIITSTLGYQNSLFVTSEFGRKFSSFVKKHTHTRHQPAIRVLFYGKSGKKRGGGGAGKNKKELKKEEGSPDRR